MDERQRTAFDEWIGGAIDDTEFSNAYGILACDWPAEISRLFDDAVATKNSDVLREHVPVAWFGDRIEELDAAVGHAQRTGREVAIVDQVEQILSDLLLGQLIGWRVIVAGQFADFSEVTNLSAFGHSSQLQILREYWEE